jgi:hypothetical protein
MSKPSITLSSVVAQSPELVSTRLGAETALMSVAHGSYYGMDRVGSRIWELIAQPRRVGSVVDELLGEFSVERSLCEQHVIAFLQKLAEVDLVQVSDAPAA